MRIAALLLLGFLAWATPGAAQTRLQGPAPSSLFGYRQVSGPGSGWGAEPDDSLRKVRPTYWKEGAVAGGLVGMVTGALLFRRLCGLDESTDDCSGSTLVGAALGAALVAIPGALIGGQFSKNTAEADSGGAP